LEPRHPALKAVLDFGRSKHRAWVSTALAEPLSRLDAPTRQRALDKLVIITDVYTWKLLRRDLGRSIHATAATMKDLLDGTLAEFSTTNHK
jgi:hypothetical protein